MPTPKRQIMRYPNNDGGAVQTGHFSSETHTFHREGRPAQSISFSTFTNHPLTPSEPPDANLLPGYGEEGASGRRGGAVDSAARTQFRAKVSLKTTAAVAAGKPLTGWRVSASEPWLQWAGSLEPSTSMEAMGRPARAEPRAWR